MGKIKYKRQYLAAINKLIKSYEQIGEGVLQGGCPLCRVGEQRKTTKKEEYEEDLVCKYCPWVLTERATCLALGYDKHYISERLERLYRWKELYKR
jgi:hypothetical protein